VTLTSYVRSALHWLPVVWITAHGCSAVHEDAARLGVYRCLEKPVEVNVFRQVAEQALKDRISAADDQ
jgi:DNA-binding NtrC family response regulator